ncbi:hypothetical protein Plhal304r1_c029g0094461 [Plasmopara halstedii]
MRLKSMYHTQNCNEDVCFLYGLHDHFHLDRQVCVFTSVKRDKEGHQVSYNRSHRFIYFATIPTILQMGKWYDLNLGIPWLSKHEPWIDWRSKPIANSSPGEGQTLGSNELTLNMQRCRNSSRIGSFIIDDESYDVGDLALLVFL